MILRRTEQFDEWLKNLRDKRAVAKIGARLDRLAEGNPGNSRSVGGGIIELKSTSAQDIGSTT
jgi:putative addiction module killer protein